MKSKTLNINGRLTFLDKPLVMGILNVTPDSFYTGSRQSCLSAIARRVEAVIGEGGAFIDVGGYSTRPGAAFVSMEEEWSRLEPALRLLKKDYPAIPVSIDTFRSELARRAVEEYGVAMVNDVSGGAWDEDMFQLVARLNVPYVLMHLRGSYDTVHSAKLLSANAEEVVTDVLMFFAERLRQLRLLGVNDVILDPGFGFSKSLDGNYELMRRLPEIAAMFDCPLLVGVSRKRMVCEVAGCAVDDSLNATTALNTFALLHGADILRVHDVRAAVEAIEIIYKLKH